MKKQANNHLLWMLAFVISIAAINPLNAQLADGQDKFLGNLIYQGSVPLNFDLYWNQVTPENAGKWASCEQARDDFNYWGWLDVAYNHARENGYPFKQHNMVWGHSSGEPDWMNGLSQSEQLEEVIEWYETFAARYPDVEMVDVVNEPLHDQPGYKEALGGDGATGWDWVIWSFEKAREVFPNAELILNEYNILNYTNECDAFLEIVEVLQSRGLIDGIGCESHSLENIAFITIQRNLEALAATGLDIYISELELRGDDNTQLQLYQQLFPYFWEHPAVKGITLWGYVDGEMWRNEGHLIKQDGTERPAMVWLKEYFDYDVPPGDYTLTTNASGQGSVSVSPAGGTYPSGTEVTVTATPASGWEFTGWSGSSTGNTNPLLVTMTSNLTLTANFQEIGTEPDTYTLTVSASGNGNVTLSPAGGVYDAGTVVTLTAVPGSGNIFAGWSGDLSGSQNPMNVTVNSNLDITAAFEQDIPDGDCSNPLSVTLPFTQDGAATTCFFTDGDINYINSWNMQVVEVNGVDFTNVWSNSMPARQDGGYYIYYEANVGWAHLEVDGTDDDNPPVTYTLSTQVSGTGSVSLSPAGGVYEEGTVVTLTATPGTSYDFINWGGDLTGTANPATIVMDGDKTVTAVFEEDIQEPEQFTLTVSTSGNGSVSLSPAGGAYDEGTVVTLTASAGSDYEFTGWSGDLSGSQNPVNVTMSSDLSVTAVFELSGNEGGDCESPENITGPFSYNGSGTFCWFTTSEPGYINSWNLDLLEVNGVDFTNTWANSFPAPVDGGYYFYYEGSFAWSHFEISAPKSATADDLAEPVSFEMLIFPNPATAGSFAIDLQGVDSEIMLTITDMSGKQIESILIHESGELLIDRNLQPGIYIVKAIAENSLQIETLIVK